MCIVNDGFHQHRRPGHILHIAWDEQIHFQALVNAHPTVGPLGLIVGIPGVAGPGESVTDISDVFLNAGHVGKEHLKLKKGSQIGGDVFIAAFTKFSRAPWFYYILARRRGYCGLSAVPFYAEPDGQGASPGWTYQWIGQ